MCKVLTVMQVGWPEFDPQNLWSKKAKFGGTYLELTGQLAPPTWWTPGSWETFSQQINEQNLVGFLGGRGFLHFTAYILSWEDETSEKALNERIWSQELKQRPLSTTAAYWLAPHAYSGCFLIHPSLPARLWHHLLYAGYITHQS